MVEHIVIGVLKTVYYEKEGVNFMTGVKFRDATYRVQIESESHDGKAIKFELIEMDIDNPQDWHSFVNKKIYIHTSQEIRWSKRELKFTPLSGSKPELYKTDEKQKSAVAA